MNLTVNGRLVSEATCSASSSSAFFSGKPSAEAGPVMATTDPMRSSGLSAAPAATADSIHAAQATATEMALMISPLPFLLIGLVENVVRHWRQQRRLGRLQPHSVEGFHRHRFLEPAARRRCAPKGLTHRIVQAPADRLGRGVAGEVVTSVELKTVAIGIAHIDEQRVGDAMTRRAALDAVGIAGTGEHVAGA